MTQKMKIELIRRLLVKGLLNEAEVACEELNVCKAVIKKLQEELC